MDCPSVAFALLVSATHCGHEPPTDRLRMPAATRSYDQSAALKPVLATKSHNLAK